MFFEDVLDLSVYVIINVRNVEVHVFVLVVIIVVLVVGAAVFDSFQIIVSVTVLFEEFVEFLLLVLFVFFCGAS